MASHDHLHRRHRRAAEPLIAPEVLAAPLEERAQTLVSVVYVTASPTFTGAIGGYSTVGAVASTSSEAPKATTPAAVQSSASSAAKVSSSSAVASSIAADTSSAASSSLPTEITAPSTSLASSIAVLAATSSLSTSTKEASATSISAASATSSSDASSSSSGGMSTGGKAGLAIGILLLVGAILAMVLYCFKRRKEAAKQPLADREKQQDPFADSLARQQSTHSVQSTRSAATAPRLSLRPVTQFIPNLMEKRASRGNALMNVGAAQNEKTIPMERPITPQSDNVANPFGNHAEAIDAQNAKGPSPVTTPVEEVAGAGIALARGASKRGNGPKPLDFTKAGPFMGPPSPAGTEFSTTSDSVSTPTQTTSSAAIAAAGGPANSAVHRVQLDFKPSMDDELELRAGQLIRLLHEYDDGWVSPLAISLHSLLTLLGSLHSP